MKRYYVVLMMALFALEMSATERTEQQMRQAAMSVLNTNRAKVKGTSSQPPSLKQMKRLPKLAVYGYEDGGFAVVTSDDRFKDVIGYSETAYRDTIMPCGFEWWLKAVNMVMELTEGTSVASSRAMKAPVSGRVDPLMTTSWGQNEPFYNHLRYRIADNTYQFVTGCVATAMAQVMNFHRHPTKGVGSHSYTVRYNNVGSVVFSSNFDEHTYDWDNMLDVYTFTQYYYYGLYPNFTQAQADAVATLMADCAISINTILNGNASSARTSAIAPALKEFFSYSNSTKLYRRSMYSDNEWMSLVYNELSAGRPIIYSGSGNEESGHCFVLHGYDSNGYVYVNWGWNGYYDGYYDIDLLNPDVYSYAQDQEMVFVSTVEEVVEPEKCATPTIAYNNGKLTFSCETPGVEFVPTVTVTNDQVKTDDGSEIVLAATYHVSVYATKDGYLNSDTATADFAVESGGSIDGKLGDINGDDKVNVTDVIKLVNIIVGNE